MEYAQIIEQKLLDELKPSKALSNAIATWWESELHSLKEDEDMAVTAVTGGTPTLSMNELSASITAMQAVPTEGEVTYKTLLSATIEKQGEGFAAYMPGLFGMSEMEVYEYYGVKNPSYRKALRKYMRHIIGSKILSPKQVLLLDYTKLKAVAAKSGAYGVKHGIEYCGQKFGLWFDGPKTAAKGGKLLLLSPQYKNPIVDAQVGYRSVCDTIGLNPDIDLTQSVADFYILENLYSQLWPSSWEDQRFKRGVFPGGFGDTRSSMRAYDVKYRLEALEQRLADAFTKYIIIACGGEMRHIFSRCGDVNIWQCTTKAWDPTKLKYANGTIIPQEGFEWEVNEGTLIIPPPVSNLGGAGVGPSGRTGAWKKWFEMTADDPIGGLRLLGALFDYPVWRPTSRGVGRTGVFHNKDGTLYEADYPDKMAGTGYGGPKWGQPAWIAADYMDGRLTARTFVDRCWTLQHNGGSLFNKLYDTNKLMEVLQVQANNPDYSMLAHYASMDVRDLWIRQQVATGKPSLVLRPTMAVKTLTPSPEANVLTFTKVENAAFYIPQSDAHTEATAFRQNVALWQNSDLPNTDEMRENAMAHAAKYGPCPYCFEAHKEKGPTWYNTCGGYGLINGGCMYNNESHESPEQTWIDWHNDHNGCPFCYYNYTVTGESDPCGGDPHSCYYWGKIKEHGAKDIMAPPSPPVELDELAPTLTLVEGEAASAPAMEVSDFDPEFCSISDSGEHCAHEPGDFWIDDGDHEDGGYYNDTTWCCNCHMDLD